MTDRIKRNSLSAQIAEALRSDIVFGRLEPGARVGQQDICERFGTSRMPVRDALRELMYEGLLTQDSGRHAIVAEISRPYIEDTYVINGALQGLACARVAKAADREVVNELRERHREMLAAQDDSVRLGELNRAFHDRIVALAASPKLASALRTVTMNMPTDASFLIQFPEWRAHVNEEHAPIIEAIERGDADGADRLMREHVASAGRHLIDSLARGGTSEA